MGNIMNHNEKSELVQCCVKNCQKLITPKEAIKIDGKYFCGSCGTAYYRSALNI